MSLECPEYDTSSLLIVIEL